MKQIKTKKSSKAGMKVNLISSIESQEMLLMGSALGEQMMGMMSQVATSPRGMGAAASALAMVWATLKDIATCEGVEVESLFESEVEHWSLTIEH